MWKCLCTLCSPNAGWVSWIHLRLSVQLDIVLGKSPFLKGLWECAIHCNFVCEGLPGEWGWPFSWNWLTQFCSLLLPLYLSYTKTTSCGSSIIDSLLKIIISTKEGNWEQCACSLRSPTRSLSQDLCQELKGAQQESPNVAGVKGAKFS